MSALMQRGARGRARRAADRGPPARARVPGRGGRPVPRARQPGDRVQLGARSTSPTRAACRSARRASSSPSSGRRPSTIEAPSPDGERARIEAEGLEARVIQHEVDHLDGVLILDRTTPEERKRGARRAPAAARARPLALCGSPSRRPRRSAPPCSRGSPRAHEVELLLTRPDRPRGRGRRVGAPPAKEVAERLGIPVAQPERLGAFPGSAPRRSSSRVRRR